MDNLTEAENCRLELIHKIQELYQQGFSIHRIARITGKMRHTVRKYREGDPQELCKGNKCSCMNGYEDYIIESIQAGLTQARIAERLQEMGYQKTIGNARRRIADIARRHGLELAKYGNEPPVSKKTGKRKKFDYIHRKGIFNFLWMNGELTAAHYKYMWKKHPVLQEVETCIRQFRENFDKKNMALLYIFIDKYKRSSIKEIASFAKGLERDIEAVENAVASKLSNGFVEGTNNKVKMIKRTMYGRCGKALLAAKLIYQPTTKNG